MYLGLFGCATLKQGAGKTDKLWEDPAHLPATVAIASKVFT